MLYLHRPEKRDEKRRKHNETSRRGRNKINELILVLKSMLPQCRNAPQNKATVLHAAGMRRSHFYTLAYVRAATMWFGTLIHCFSSLTTVLSLQRFAHISNQWMLQVQFLEGELYAMANQLQLLRSGTAINGAYYTRRVLPAPPHQPYVLPAYCASYMPQQPLRRHQLPTVHPLSTISDARTISTITTIKTASVALSNGQIATSLP